MAGITAFQQAYLSAGIENSNRFEDFNARQVRYAFYWAFYENTAYNEMVNSFSRKMKIERGLYKHIRAIYNPAYRLASFYQAHLMGGALDPNASAEKKFALPIDIPDTNLSADALRLSIGVLWKTSNWQIRKDIFTLRGAVMGDVGLRVVDDPERGAVYLESIHPNMLKEIKLDSFGNVKGYTIEEIRSDPRLTKPGFYDRPVQYREVVTRDGDNVVYETFLDGTPYAWQTDTQGNAQSTWSLAYGFVPMVMVKHNDIGLDWGWSEMHTGWGKFAEVDDMASKTNDQIRKLVDSPWLLSGVTAPSTTPKTTNSAATGGQPQPGREEIPMFYAPTGATATPLVAPLDLGNALLHIKEIIAEIERDYPELKADELRLQGALSGRALELAQQPAADKVLQRRPNYDNALVRAQQMAIAIGGMRGYKGYDGFDLNSFDAGLLDHSIGERDVFKRTRGERLDEDLIFYQGVNVAQQAGIAPETVMRRDGWSEDEINDNYGAMPNEDLTPTQDNVNGNGNTSKIEATPSAQTQTA